MRGPALAPTAPGAPGKLAASRPPGTPQLPPPPPLRTESCCGVFTPLRARGFMPDNAEAGAYGSKTRNGPAMSAHRAPLEPRDRLGAMGPAGGGWRMRAPGARGYRRFSV